MKITFRVIGRMVGITILVLLTIVLIILAYQYYSIRSFMPSSKILNAKNYLNGKFVNGVPTKLGAEGKFWETTYEFLFGGQKDRKPSKPLPVVRLGEKLRTPAPDRLQFVWLGHSSILLELEGKRFLIDPVFSERASFTQWAGPKRFHPVPLLFEELPQIDAVLISHDHYDHLDKSVIRQLSEVKVRFCVPLGIGRLLEEWGIDRSFVTEFDWWDELGISPIKIISTPARHFSGRGVFDLNTRLWCSWTLVGKDKKVFFSGDTGILPDFDEVGERFGPFDIAFIKIGAYDKNWPDIHINPEQAIEVHKQIKGCAMVPIHWATFDLGLHSWYDPVERLLLAARPSNTKLITPRIGELVNPMKHKNSYWWREFS